MSAVYTLLWSSVKSHSIDPFFDLEDDGEEGEENSKFIFKKLGKDDRGTRDRKKSCLIFILIDIFLITNLLWF